MTCTMDDCEKVAVSRTWCEMHYTRWKRHGDPNGFAYIQDREQRFWSKVDASGDCWIWTGYCRPSGHGSFSMGYRQMGFAHRVAWEYLVGEIPEGLELDHLCRNPPCVNPDHLQIISPSEHTRLEKRRRYGPPDRLCSVQGCSNKASSRDLCGKHYRRWRIHGDPLKEPLDEWDRFWSKVDIGDHCWEWAGAIHETGYGFCLRDGQKWYAHRLSWTMLKGPIPQDHIVAHRCSTRSCVNPDHLLIGERVS